MVTRQKINGLELSPIGIEPLRHFLFGKDTSEHFRGQERGKNMNIYYLPF
jgi:hypothetical protein